ncbi:phenylacetate-CoA ligase [Anaerolineae bacterium]|nr:phenylacetate-CoA ligase [Anaerolineae bacterium]
MDVSYFDREIETAPREKLHQHQTARMQTLLHEVLTSNAFYGKKLRDAGFTDARDFKSVADMTRLPFTKKQELVDDQDAHPPFGTNLTYPIERYVRVHQTSGTTGRPMRWLDTRESWDWWARCWGAVFRAAGLGEHDRIFFAFSFGPFIGFWAAWAGSEKIGALAISGGAQDSYQRLRNLIDLQATALCCTPSYALHLIEEAHKQNVDLRASGVKRIVVAGEPGGSIPGTKARIEEGWNAKLFDHTGATEVGAHGFTCVAQNGVHLNEGEFLIEVVDPKTGEPADEGELILTNLDRVGSPIVRYRTGDQVRLNRATCECGRTFARMDGGIIGRIDQMFIIRGVNIFPSSIEAIVRAYPQVQEFAIELDTMDAMDQLQVKVEVAGENPQSIVDAIARDMAHRLALRVPITLVSPETLPRFELKARRITDRRKK